MGACLALFRHKRNEEDNESMNALLKGTNNKTSSMEIELSEPKPDSKPKHKTSDCDELLLDMIDERPLDPKLITQLNLETRRIKFANVEVRQYSRCMDYHPCVSSGVPLGLDWEFEVDEVLTVDEYESSRGVTRVERQQYACIGRLDSRLRLALALRSGHTLEEIEDMVDQVALARRARVLAAAERKQHAQKSLLQWLHGNNTKSNSAFGFGALGGLFSGWSTRK